MAFTVEDLVPGRRFEVKNQGTTMTPRTVLFEIAWVAPDRVYYKMVGQPYSGSTTLERFLWIINQ
jgi:hypothetical protein